MRRLLIDLAILVASVAAAVAIAEFDLVHHLALRIGDGFLLASFVAGIFFTSVATTLPAIAVLGQLGQEGNLFLTALFGGLGAVIGDYLIFAFVRDRIAGDLSHFMSRSALGRMRALFRRKTFRWMLPFLGGLIIASPLPDELGLALLGMSKLNTALFVPLSFCFNSTGILLIGLAARALQ